MTNKNCELLSVSVVLSVSQLTV